MSSALKLSKQTSVLYLTFIFFTIWWVLIQLSIANQEQSIQLFTGTYGIIAAIGGIWGLVNAKRWGGWSSVMGKSIIMFSLGLFFQELGQLAYFYYIYHLKIEVPYPSLGDIGYFATIPFYIFAIIFLAKASGVKLQRASLSNKLYSFILPLILLLITYFLFFRNYIYDWANPIVIFLDLAYPVGDVFYISLAILTYILCKSVLGGVMRNKILFILCVLCFQFMSDFIFLYQARNGLWSPGGINDFMYMCSYFLMSMAIIQLNSIYTDLHK